jgi:sugar phosphate isomerase/epimerase
MTMTRRKLFGAPVFISLARAADVASALRPVRLGGPIFLKSDDPRELAREHRRLGYTAAYCPVAAPSDVARTREIREAFAAENVVIAEVGAWKNLLDPDAEKRSENLKYVIERLELAEAVAARCCVDIAGSFNPKVWYGPDPKNLSEEFFEATVENCRKIVDAVKPRQTKFSIEMMPWNLPDGPDSYVRLMRAVDRKGFGVHMDICNILNSPTRLYRNAEVISECFRKLGQWTLSCHAKDLEWMTEYNVHFREVVPGRGQVNYQAYLRELAMRAPEAPLMLEHLKTPEEYEEGRNYIRRVAGQAGVTIL